MPDSFERPIATVDAALFTLWDDELCVVVAERETEPDQGKLALIGGYVHVNEDKNTLATAKRVLRQKIGFSAAYLEQLYTFSGMVRDPRGWSISVAYYAVVAAEKLRPEKGNYQITPVRNVPKLAFDHNEIVQFAVKRLRNKATYSSLPAFLLPKHFTIPQLVEVYRNVIGIEFDPMSFRYKLMRRGSIIEPVEGRERGAGRPAQLYRLAMRNLSELDRQLVSRD